MSSYPGNELQTAIYTVLNAKVGLTGYVYDAVPDNTDLPYVIMGDEEINEFDTKDRLGAEVFIEIHIWTESRGRKDCKTLQNLVHSALQYQEDKLNNELTNHRVILITQEFSDTSLENDGVTYHGVQRFRCITREV